MYILVLIALYGASGVSVKNIYYSDKVSCTAAAREVDKTVLPPSRVLGSEVHLKAFCIRGDSE